MIGFYFVSDLENGLTDNRDGTLWTGTWVVGQDHAEEAARIGAYVALHKTKSELSSLQGAIIGWRKAARANEYGGRTFRIADGIDFLFRSDLEPREWVGDGAAEKGYNWVLPPDKPPHAVTA